MIQQQKELYMRRCFQLARKAWRTTSFNPVVGAVLVFEDRIIGEGYHEVYGEEHAEVNCIKSVSTSDRKLIKGASLFVSLEPCSFIGKTPACSTLIIEHKIKQVFISCIDPNPLVSGNGIEFLRNKEIQVETEILQKEGEILLRKFKVNHLKKRPFVALKWAQSSNGISGVEGESVWFTNAFSRVLAHKLRANFEAIMVGTNTVIVDSPSLDNRLYPGANPIKIILDKHARISEYSKTFGGSQNVKIITSKMDYKDYGNHIEIIYISEQNYTIDEILHQLYLRNISSVLVEGGPTLQKSFIKDRLWDEAHVLSSKNEHSGGIVSPRVEGYRYESVSLQQDRYEHILR